MQTLPSPTLLPGDKRQPCRHCGELQKPRGLANHERQCARNPDRRLPRRPVALAAAPEPVGALVAEADPPTERWACSSCGLDEDHTLRSISDPGRCKQCVSTGRTAVAAGPPKPLVTPSTDLVVCAACEREGTPSRRDPALCVACGISAEMASTRKALFIPPRSEFAQVALDIATRAEDPGLRSNAWRAYLRARAADFGNLEGAA